MHIGMAARWRTADPVGWKSSGCLSHRWLIWKTRSISGCLQRECYVQSLPAVRDSDSITRGLTIGFRKYEKDYRNDVTYRG